MTSDYKDLTLEYPWLHASLRLTLQACVFQLIMMYLKVLNQDSNTKLVQKAW